MHRKKTPEIKKNGFGQNSEVGLYYYPTSDPLLIQREEVCTHEMSSGFVLKFNGLVRFNEDWL